MDKLPRLAAYRIAAEQMATDARYRREIQRSGRPMLSAYRTRSDEELCAELQRLGLGVTRESFAELAAGHDSAEALARASAESLQLGLCGFEPDSVWLCLWVLWERWLPERPPCEQVDDWVVEGCRQAHEDDHAAACAAWLRAWGFVRDLARARGLRSLDDVDAVLQGSESFFNWVQDFEMSLSNAGLDDKAWCREGLRFCREYLELFEPAEREITENMRRALAGFHFALGQSDVCDRLYEEWLRADPQWGWGWIGWSDEYGMGRVPKDLARAEALLRRGLAVPGVQPVGDLRERLHSLHEGAGHRNAEGDPAQAPTSALETYVRPAPKVGRNDPCACGSGKKHKKCCLK